MPAHISEAFNLDVQAIVWVALSFVLGDPEIVFART